MQPKTPKLLEDVRDASSFVLQATAGSTLDEYRGNRLLRQAVERNFEIIGEAVGRIARDDPAIAAQLGPYRQIIAFRNVLIHGYDVVDDEQVWRVIVNELPELERTTVGLLAAALD